MKSFKSQHFYKNIYQIFLQYFSYIYIYKNTGHSPVCLAPPTFFSLLYSVIQLQTGTLCVRRCACLHFWFSEWIGSMWRGRGACWDCSGIWGWIVGEDEQGGFHMRTRQSERTYKSVIVNEWQKEVTLWHFGLNTSSVSQKTVSK